MHTAPPGSMKKCPQCQQAHALDAQFCPCGHRFSTQFAPPNRTTVILPYAGPVGQPYMVAQANQGFEWRMKCFWCWFGAFMGLCLMSISIFQIQFNQFSAYWAIGYFGVACACAVGLNRLYGKLIDLRGLMITGSILGVLWVGTTVMSYKQVEEAKAEARAEIERQQQIETGTPPVWASGPEYQNNPEPEKGALPENLRPPP